MAYTPLVDGDAATPAVLNAIFTELDNSIGGGGGVAGGAQFINVLDSAYGAVGDGATDDSAAVALAIAACDSTLGGTILFPGGKNYVIDTVTIDVPNVVFVAWGAKFTKAATTATHMFKDTAGAADGFKLYGGTFDLSRASFSNGDTVSAFFFVRTQNIYFHGATFQNGIEEGLKLYRTKYTRVHNCVFNNIRNDGVQLLATDSDSYTGAGRSTQSVEWVWIHGCHFKDIDDGLDGGSEGQAALDLSIPPSQACLRHLQLRRDVHPRLLVREQHLGLPRIRVRRGEQHHLQDGPPRDRDVRRRRRSHHRECASRRGGVDSGGRRLVREPRDQARRVDGDDPRRHRRGQLRHRLSCLRLP